MHRLPITNFLYIGMIYIEDKEFDLSDVKNDDLLGTSPYAETLFEVVKQSKGNQNIGLFGGWGSGKSTIVKTLENFILKNNKEDKKNKIGFFKYDSWKYSNDDFRRSFIKSLNSYFKIISEEKINELLYQETTSQNPNKSKIVFDYPKIVLLIISATILIGLVGIFVLPNIGNDDIKSILVIVSLLASFLLFISKESFRIIPFSVKNSKVVEAERFEDTFKLVTKGIFGEKISLGKKIQNCFLSISDYKKLVIVIDNLDRCDYENLRVTLSSLKNFLETENVLFILPVDENGLISFLNEDIENAEEFLRKIFHQIIRLKKFTPKELIDFTNKLNDRYELNLSKIGIRLICQEFTTNPRKIIQFLNNLQTERDLIKRQIDKGYVKLDYDEKADDFLIKLLIIKQEWNWVYQKILDDSSFLSKINNAITHELENEDDSFFVKVDYDRIELSRNQKRFFKRNLGIHRNDVEAFVLNIDRDKDVPDNLRSFIENGELEEAFNALNMVDENDFTTSNVKLFLGQIDNVFDDYSNKFEDYHSIALPVTELIVGLVKIDSFEKEINTNFKDYLFINRIFSSEHFTGLIGRLNSFEDFCKTTKWFFDSLKYKVPFSRLREFLENDMSNLGFTHSEINRFNNFLSIYKEDYLLLAELQEKFSHTLRGDLNNLKKFEILQTNLNLSKCLLNNDFFAKGLEILNKAENKNFEWEKVFLDLGFKFIDSKIVNDKSIISDMTNQHFIELEKARIEKSRTGKGVIELEPRFRNLSTMIKLSEKKLLNFNTNTFKNIKSDLDVLFKTNMTNSEIHCFTSFFEMVLNYMHINVEYSTKNNINLYFNFYFKQNISPKIESYINQEIYRKEIKRFGPYDWSFFELLVNKMSLRKKVSYMSTMMMMYKKTTHDSGLTDNQKEVLIKNLIVLSFFKNDRKSIEQIGLWLKDIYKKDKEVLRLEIISLELSRLKRYVYNIHRLKDYENLILGSFSLFLRQQGNFKSFEKFNRFVYENHSVKIQLEMITEYCNKTNLGKNYNWLFSSKKVLHKKVCNYVLENYLESYMGQRDNGSFIKNLYKLDRRDLYSSKREKVVKFLDNIDNPTAVQKPKINKITKELK